jgi:hypothetical protein
MIFSKKQKFYLIAIIVITFFSTSGIGTNAFTIRAKEPKELSVEDKKKLWEASINHQIFVFGSSETMGIIWSVSIFNKFYKEDDSMAKFWPFVSYYDFSGIESGRDGYHSSNVYSFYGVFSNWDFTEFLFYGILVPLFFAARRKGYI